ncbi:PAS domain-containing protein [Arthrospiribacter ruber]|uniref:histidine kinase n=1 Tax=Arthrospiribacter ruber TaxID=2487934 RepID=A0A951IXH4_9BACT|nr:PAS domain-containing protein [Arthrospiribacter ruber]MBW3467929.1 PAS domain-containing protein [Arthrospiribacter ruber]
MLKVDEIQALIPSNIKFSDLIYVCVVDVEGQIWYANTKFQKFVGQKPLSTCEVNFSECFPDLDNDELHSFWIDVIGRPNECIKLDIDQNEGSSSWEFSALMTLEGDFGGIMGVGYPKKVVVSSATDYSFPKDVNPAMDIFFQLDHKWQFLNVNHLGEKFFEQKKDKLLGQTLWQVYPEKDIYRYALEFKKAKESKTMRVFEDFSTLNGRWYKIYILPRKAGIDVIFKDISHIQNLSEEIQQLQLTLQSVLESSEESILLVGRDLKISGYNSKAEKFIKKQFKRELNDGDKFSNYLSEGLDEIFLKEAESILNGKFKSFESEIVLKGNNSKSLFTHKFFPLIDPFENIVGFGYAFKDVQESTSKEKKMKAQNRVMRDILHHQSTLLRSPLSSILGLLELIDHSQLDTENKKYLSYLKSLAQELDKIIRQNSKKVSDLD